MNFRNKHKFKGWIINKYSCSGINIYPVNILYNFGKDIFINIKNRG